MIDSQQLAEMLEVIATYKGVPVEEVTHAEVEGNDWGSCRVKGIIYMFDFTKAGKIKVRKGVPCRYFGTVKNYADCSI
jgi:hypothetical protein